MFEVVQVNSTAILFVAYCRASHTLRVIFRNGSGYDYPDVAEVSFLRLARATSVGVSFQPFRNRRSVRLSSSEVLAFSNAAMDSLASTRVFVG